MPRNAAKKSAKPSPQPMLVECTANWMHSTGQFVFRSPHKPARRIPVSETGYRSHLPIWKRSRRR
jgi:hypothetical protein